MANPPALIRGPYRKRSGRKPTHNVRGVERRWRAGKLDERYKETQEIYALADGFAEDAGGWAHLSNREVAMVQLAAFAAWVCQQTAQWAVARSHDDGSIIARDGSVPMVLGKVFIAYGNALGRTLERLGLHPDRASRLGITCDGCGAVVPDGPDLVMRYQTHVATCTRYQTHVATRTNAAPAPVEAEPASAPADAPEPPGRDEEMAQ